jgi:hypothetical protein
MQQHVLDSNMCLKSGLYLTMTRMCQQSFVTIPNF